MKKYKNIIIFTSILILLISFLVYFIYFLERKLKDGFTNIDEIQDIFTRLITCADLTEVEIFKQDITKEVLNLPTKEYDLKKQLGFRSAKQSALPKNWVLNGAFIIQEITLDKTIFYDIEKQSLLFNHSNLYVKSYFDGSFWKAQIAHTTEDPNPEELELMEKHLKIFKSNLNWLNISQKK